MLSRQNPEATYPSPPPSERTYEDKKLVMTKLNTAADHHDLPAQVQHPFHPGQGHSLKLIPGNDGVEFSCNGCKLPGTGARYECERGAACNLDLHIRCALASPLREIGGNRFVLLHEPFPGDGRTICDACGGDATGFAYHCPDLDHDVHPCCADLPETLDLAGVFLELRFKDVDGHCPICAEKKTWWCGRRVNRGCWSYRSIRGGGDDDVFLHVACVRSLVCDDRFTNAPLGKAMASRASETGTGTVDVYRIDQEMVTVKASALRALLLKGQGRGGHRGRGRSFIRVLTFIVRVVIGVIFGDPTAMIVAVGQAVFSGEG